MVENSSSALDAIASQKIVGTLPCPSAFAVSMADYQKLWLSYSRVQTLSAHGKGASNIFNREWRKRFKWMRR